ncbi:1-pyrroline-5-carboxylate dehydrogenase [Dyadobacter sp. BE34]|uniref:L-glutamate gamma-semialdehyde dehydrogenase n=1 Tax=Dyadobacter fermentans TaxID=94254 RepID=A0ABU1RA26_9BACT|nr:MULTISPECIES: L-glutamate gamma-semialdehyde dehydrogenase [Dyadobacter]MDR6809795.1 1-pyrroline-5-carboxylate dehydrogenase [Dyadobacter fermentans]MDR7047539.1 1-pyrroline-5-carboxylate dehydrogenase [Dyadobacter sp. BE242]MDR7201709.1 1-pyrroline-5-carboxylate dehydrogenase [Dyadobacter sp. BE34]MDR7219579.1 1-pyrroline-5-carboxylate dehydrogenase [Dyadobacter sp. BE31]MDR7267365.1 1-pyrroline-5-carboxylate dehydrogenase [Dyadobacter sp. BE32]
MSIGIFNVPALKNEPVKSYAPGTPERSELKKALAEARAKVIDIPQYIGSEEVYSQNKKVVSPPHDHQHVLGYFHEGTKEDVAKAIDAALEARKGWATLTWEQRAAIFLKAAELIAGPYRAEMNAATMLGQSKNAYQAEIDSACEIIDFLRLNVNFMRDIYEEQPISSEGVWNRMEYRPLEGFIFAITPFNFTAIAGNLPAAPALMGNVVIWKPAFTQVYAANVIMRIFKEAGLPDGVINMVLADGPVAGDVIFKHPDFSGVHFTGSTKVFQTIWKTIGENIATYKTFPRIVGETGGKDFVLAHKSADAKAVATGLVRGAFEYQGQKCSAASRAYIPSNLWDEVKAFMLADLAEIKMGGVEDFSNFVNAVIDEKSFDKIASYIDGAKSSADTEIVAGGNFDKSKGYFVEPTIIQAFKPDYVTLCEEIFGPVLTIYVYDENEFEQIIPVIDATSPYALTGAVFSKDRYAIEYATRHLVNAAGNFYINDKPTGAVVGQQPFGGARASGTNDKAGSVLNLLRWVSPRALKETLVSPKDYKYPFLSGE